AGAAVGGPRAGRGAADADPAGGDDLAHGCGDGAARAETLGNVADTAPVAEPAQGCSVHAYLTAVEGHDAEHRPHEGRLPRAVGAQYRSGPTRGYVEAHAVENGHTAVGDGGVDGLECGWDAGFRGLRELV